MTLLITVFATIICTVLWYKKAPDDCMKISVLCFMYGGASLMWLIDAIFEYTEMGEEFFTPALEDMVNDSFLGFSVVALGLVAWLIILFVKDPEGVVRASLLKKS
jgi:hypothetical protein